MALELDICDNNEITIYHVASGSKIKFFYTNPDTDVHIQYKSAILHASAKGKSIEDVQKIQIEFGLKLIKGIRKGDFILNKKQISSDPADPDYLADWKEVIKRVAGNIIIKFVEQILDSSCYAIKDEAANADFFAGSTNPS
jgi:hypothetical protein